jgi:hypothetical protein
LISQASSISSEVKYSKKKLEPAVNQYLFSSYSANSLVNEFFEIRNRKFDKLVSKINDIEDIINRKLDKLSSKITDFGERMIIGLDKILSAFEKNRN